MAGTFGGGGSGGWPTIFRCTQAPRFTGEVTVPFAVTFRTAAWVKNPPRPLSAGNGTRRMAEPTTSGMP